MARPGDGIELARSGRRQQQGVIHEARRLATCLQLFVQHKEQRHSTNDVPTELPSAAFISAGGRGPATA